MVLNPPQPHPQALRSPRRSILGPVALALLGSIGALGGTGRLSPAHAHQVQVTEGVGATLHIEPNDIPRAGVATPVWFALTQPGGVVIPLEDCACELTLWADDGSAIASPPLSAVTAEGYEDIPGAQVTFPEVGRYSLVLNGAPIAPATFPAFDLTFEVTVAAAARSETTPETAPETTPETAPTPATAAESAPEANGEPISDAETSGAAAASRFPYGALGWMGGLGAILLTAGAGLVVYRRRSPGAKS